MGIRLGIWPAPWLLLPFGDLVILAGTAILLLWGGIHALLGGPSNAMPARPLTVVISDVRLTDSSPPLEFVVGQPVALTVVNGDESTVHDFVIADLGVRTNGSLAPGASQTLQFTPSRAGTFAYACTFHPGLKAGKVVVLWHSRQ